MSELLLAESQGYRALWSSVILNAFRELKTRTNSSDNISPETLRLEAYRWINDPWAMGMDWNPETKKMEMRKYRSCDVGGIEWICDHLDLSVDWLRQMSMTRAGIERVLNGHDRLTGRHKVKVEEDEE
jgi:hypothetical protein